MKSTAKLGKILSAILAVIMVSSTMSVPQNLVLAAQLADIEIIEDSNEEDSTELTPSEENKEDSTELTPSEENEEDNTELASSEENEEDSTELTPGEENEEGSTELASSEESEEDSTELTSSEESEEDSTELTPSEENKEDSTELTSSEENKEDSTELTSSEENKENSSNLNEDKENSNLVSPLAVNEYLDFDKNTGTIRGFSTGVFVPSEIVIPVQIEGVDVVEIAPQAFLGRNLKTVVFEDGSKVQKIGDKAFANNYNLSKINLPSELVTIGQSAFWNTAITGELVIPDKVTSIGNSAFSNSKLESVILPDSLTKINSNTFNENNLSNIKLPANLETIESHAFSQCTGSIESLVLPNSLKKIGISAFWQTSIKNIKLSENLETIERQAFSNCGLENIELPTSLKTIGEDAFNSNNITKLTIPANISEIGKNAFYNCKKLESLTIENGNLTTINHAVFANTALKGKIVIPENVKNVNLSAFAKINSNMNLDELEIKGDLDLIDTSGFGVSYGYNKYLINTVKVLKINTVKKFNPNTIGYGKSTTKNLEKIIINMPKSDELDSYFKDTEDAVVYYQDTVVDNDWVVDSDGYIKKYIGNDADVNIPETISGETISGGSKQVTVKGTAKNVFKNQENIESITMSDNIVDLGVNTFYGCKNLKNVTLSNNLSTISDYLFYGCENLLNITIPSSVQSIGNSSFFNCTALSQVSISQGIKSIGNSAFYSCTGLKEITIPATVSTIGYSAFNSSGLEKVVIEDGPDALQAIPNSLFNECKNLKDVTLPSTITSIGQNAFNECKSLKELVIPGHNITEDGINSDAFYTETIVKLPEYSRDTINGAPWRAKAIIWKETILVDDFVLEKEQNGNVSLRSYLGDKDTITIPETIQYENTQNGNIIEDLTITSIYNEAFRGNTTIKNVDIKAPITEIGTSAFYDCENLKTITFPDSLEIIKNAAFYECEKLETVNISENSNLKIIGSSAFAWDKKLSEIYIPKGVTEIGSQAFCWCYGLGKVTFGINEYLDKGNTIKDGEGLKKIGLRAFENCGFKEIKLPDTLEILEQGVFYNCRSLESIELNEGLTSIPGVTFEECIKLNNVVLPSTIKQIDGNAFKNCTNLTNITLNEGLESISNVYKDRNSVTYKDGSPFLNAPIKNINIPSTLKVAYFRNSGIEEAILPEGVTEFSFENCKSLKTVKLPSTVTKIDMNSFKSCTELVSVILPNTLKTIDNYVFQNCTNLSYIELPEGLERINSDAFKNTKIEKIVIPSTVKTISEAFDSNVKEIQVKQRRNGSPIQSSVPWGATNADVLFLGEYVGINYTLKRTDADTFVMDMLFDGAGLTISDIENYKGEKEKVINSSYHKNSYPIDVENTLNLEDTVYTFKVTADFKDPTTANIIQRSYSENVRLQNFISYLDSDTDKHLSQIDVDLNNYKTGSIATITNQKPEKSGYTFLGWSTNKNDTNPKYLPGQTIYINNNLNLYPVFTQKQTVTLTLDYGYEIDGVYKIDNIEVIKDETYQLENAKRYGYDFQGWYDDNDKVYTSILMDSNKTLKAKWKEQQNSQVELTLNYNYKGAPIKSIQLYKGQQYVIEEPTLLGYKFVGWYDNPNCKGEVVTNGKISIQQDTMLWARWEIDNNAKIKLTLNHNYENGPIEDKYIPKGQDYVVESPIRAGYTFEGWYLTEKCEGNKVENPVNYHRDMTLYAKWKENPKPTTITTENATETTTEQNNSETTSVTTESRTETTTTTTTNTVIESTTNNTQTTTDNNTETTTNNVESSTQDTTNNQNQGTTENVTNNTEQNTEATTNNNVTPPIINNQTNNNNRGGTQELDNQQQNQNTPERYTFGNLEEITPEYEELARQAISNIVVDREAIDNSVNMFLDNIENNGQNIQDRRLTEKPAFGFGAEGNISLLIILLLILIALVIGYTIKKQIFDKEKNKEDEDDEQYKDESLTI